jgi:hypothetical protein
MNDIPRKAGPCEARAQDAANRRSPMKTSYSWS